MLAFRKRIMQIDSITQLKQWNTICTKRIYVFFYFVCIAILRCNKNSSKFAWKILSNGRIGGMVNSIDLTIKKKRWFLMNRWFPMQLQHYQLSCINFRKKKNEASRWHSVDRPIFELTSMSWINCACWFLFITKTNSNWWSVFMLTIIGKLHWFFNNEIMLMIIVLVLPRWSSRVLLSLFKSILLNFSPDIFTCYRSNRIICFYFCQQLHFIIPSIFFFCKTTRNCFFNWVSLVSLLLVLLAYQPKNALICLS